MTPGRLLFLLFAFIVATIGSVYVHGEHWPWRPTGISADLERGYYASAARRLGELESGGDPRVLNMLANLYLLGLGVEKNPSRAAKMYSRAAFAGDVAAQVNMGHIYSGGHGVPEDGEMAYAWFNLARNNGSKVGQGYMSELLADRRMRHHLVNSLRQQYATINNFQQLH